MYPLLGKCLAAGTLSREDILRKLHLAVKKACGRYAFLEKILLKLYLAANNLSDSLNLANSGPIIVFDGHWAHFF